jgi:ubiquinone/menaquinone biosynthesis C-methylase UbiE
LIIEGDKSMSSKAYFDNVADQWDGMREDFYPKAVREKALEAAGVKSGETAADIGAGSGFLSEALLREGLHVIDVPPDYVPTFMLVPLLETGKVE